MEIERKFLIKKLPDHLESYPYHLIEQAYLCTEPVVRVRKEDETYYMTYKSGGSMVREEYNLPLNKEAYESLKAKADGNLIGKKRVLIPYEAYTIELDLFDAPFAPLILAEVEFSSVDEADSFIPPNWFAEEVTYCPEYHNSTMSRRLFD